MKVIWLAHQALIPGVGMALTGQPIEMPDDKAADYIRQGKAKSAEPKKAQKQED